MMNRINWPWFRIALTSAALVMATSSSAQSLTAEQWELARNAERLAAMPVIKSVVRRWSSQQDRLIEIQYPGGEEGEIWVNELRAWLVALGVPSRYQVTVPGSGKDDLIRFKIIKGGEHF